MRIEPQYVRSGYACGLYVPTYVMYSAILPQVVAISDTRLPWVSSRRPCTENCSLNVNSAATKSGARCMRFILNIPYARASAPRPSTNDTPIQATSSVSADCYNYSDITRECLSLVLELNASPIRGRGPITTVSFKCAHGEGKPPSPSEADYVEN